MGDACSPENMVDAILPAIDELNGRVGGDLFEQSDLTRRWQANPRLWFEYYNTKQAIQAGDFGKKQTPYKIYETMRPQAEPGKVGEVVKAARRWGGGEFIVAPTERFGKGFMTPLTKRLRAFDAKYDYGSAEYSQAWKNEITPMVEKVQAGILNASENIKSDKAYHKYIKETYGLEPNQVRDAMRYLDWMREGGPTRRQRYGTAEDMTTYEKATRSFISNIARWNIPWTIYNMGDMGRVTSGFVADPRFKVSKLPKILTSLARSFNFAEGMPKELEKIQGGDAFREETKGKFGIFELSNQMQRKYAYNLDKALGGDGMGLMSSHVFDYEPWNSPEIYWDKDSAGNQLLRLGRFLMAETQRYQGLLKEVARGSERGRARAATELASDLAIKGMLFGTGAAIPVEVDAVMGAALGDEWNKFKEGMAKITPFEGQGVIGGITQDMADGVFGKNKVEVDYGKTLQAGFVVLPRFGAGAQQVAAGVERPFKRALKAVESAREGDTMAASLNATAASVALLNWLPVMQSVPASMLNSAQSAKFIEAAADTVGAKNPKAYATAMTKAAIGANNAKQAKKGSNSNKDLLKLVKQRRGN